MGSSDSYCAICGACIREFHIGSKSDKGQRVRAKMMRNMRRRRLSLSTQGARDRSPSESVSEPDDGSSITDDEHSWNLRHAYDPQVLEGHDTSWITELLLIAHDPVKRRAPRTFLCGIATYYDNQMCEGTYGHLKYGVEAYDCDKLPLHDRYSEDGFKTFACHVPCLKILARAITGAMDFHQLDPYVLHRAMHALCQGTLDSLKIDYGGLLGQEQWWRSFPGEEFSVVNPLEHISVNGATICEFILTDERRSVERSLASRTARVKKDPFCKLPTELIHQMAAHIEGHDLIALRQASRTVRQATRSSSFWKCQLFREQDWLWDTPFSMEFWEPHGRTAYTENLIDWEKLYVVLEKSTVHGFETKGWLIALANRRRIWSICEKISRVYWDLWPQRDDLRETDRLAERMPVPDDVRAYDDETESELDGENW